MLTSPSKKSSNSSQPSQISFYKALEQVAKGKKVTKLEWNDTNIYAHMVSGSLCIHTTDNLSHPFLLREVDIIGTDWIVID